VLTGVVPPVLRVPVATLVINLVGAFALGVLLEALGRRGPDHGRRRLLRLLLGTGFLGGFTTYSALSVDTVSLVRDGLVGHAVGYAAVTVVVGGLASMAGMALGARVRRGPVS
jgi:CrcB protein